MPLKLSNLFVLATLLLTLSGCAVLEVGDVVASAAVDVVSAGASVVGGAVHAVGSVLDAVTPDFKSK